MPPRSTFLQWPPSLRPPWYQRLPSSWGRKGFLAHIPLTRVVDGPVSSISQEPQNPSQLLSQPVASSQRTWLPSLAELPAVNGIAKPNKFRQTKLQSLLAAPWWMPLSVVLAVASLIVAIVTLYTSFLSISATETMTWPADSTLNKLMMLDVCERHRAVRYFGPSSFSHDLIQNLEGAEIVHSCKAGCKLDSAKVSNTD